MCVGVGVGVGMGVGMGVGVYYERAGDEKIAG